jgi:hypothetical protein
LYYFYKNKKEKHKMKNTIATLALIATTIACTESVETVETIEVDTNAVELDSTTLEGNFDDDSFGEEAVLEEVETEGEPVSEE